MTNKPMTPSGGNGAMPRKNSVKGAVPQAPVTTGRNRPTQGTDVYKLVDDASATDIRKGFEAARPSGIGASTEIFGPTGTRGMSEVNGPTFGIRARRTAQSETYSGTLAAGRLMKPAMQPVEEFLGGARKYGVTGP